MYGMKYVHLYVSSYQLGRWSWYTPYVQSFVQVSTAITIYNFVAATLANSSSEVGPIGGGSNDSSPLKCLILRNELAPCTLKTQV